jgi:hypothetical protein
MVREMGAVLQVIRQGTGNSEQAVTAFEAVLRTLQDAQKVKTLQQGGIKLFDPKAMQEGREVLRPLNEIMVEIVERAKGRKTLLSEVFDAEAMRAFNAMIAEYQRSGAVKSLGRFLNVQADGSTILRDSARAAKDAQGAIELLYTAWRKFADEKLTGPITKMADALNSLDPKTIESALTVAGVGAAGLGALVVGNQALKFGRGISGLFRRGKKSAPGSGLGSGTFGDAIPVYVVNGPMSSWGGAAGAAKSGKTGRIGGLGAAAGIIPVVGMSLLAAGAAHQALGAESDESLLNRVFPDPFDPFNQKSGKMAGELKITIDQEGRAKVTDRKTDNLDIDVDSGWLFGSLD